MLDQILWGRYYVTASQNGIKNDTMAALVLNLIYSLDT